MTRPVVQVARESVRTAEATHLIALLSAEMDRLYPEDNDGGAGDFRPEDVEASRSAFVVARIAGEAVGCGALRPLSDEIGEIKRVFVLPEWRGQGVARQLMAELETTARTFGYTAVWLETGTRQAAALTLYERTGYHPISCYGYYRNHPLSLCYEKRLVTPQYT